MFSSPPPSGDEKQRRDVSKEVNIFYPLINAADATTFYEKHLSKATRTICIYVSRLCNLGPDRDILNCFISATEKGVLLRIVTNAHSPARLEAFLQKGGMIKYAAETPPISDFAIIDNKEIFLKANSPTNYVGCVGIIERPDIEETNILTTANNCFNKLWNESNLFPHT